MRAIRLYTLEDGDENAEGEEAEILSVHESSFKVSKQNLIKRKFPYINAFNQEGPTIVNAM